MSELIGEDEVSEVSRFTLRGLLRGVSGFRNRMKYGLDLVPLYDRGGPVSLSPSADGPIATLSRVELNARNGRPLDEGLDHPDQLNQKGAP